jgi:hypothetical protein
MVIAGTRKKEDVITGSRQNAAGVILFQINLLIINIFLDTLSILELSFATYLNRRDAESAEKN